MAFLAIAASAAEVKEPSEVENAAAEKVRAAFEEPSPGLRLTPAAPPSPTKRERMTRWHRRYLVSMTAVKRGWLAALRANERVLWRDPAPVCADLVAALEAPGPAELLPVPDPVVGIHLGRSLDELSAAAGACVEGRYFESSHRFRRAASAFLEVGGLLGRYGLSP